jgi:hypothetical protein
MQEARERKKGGGGGDLPQQVINNRKDKVYRFKFTVAN